MLDYARQKNIKELTSELADELKKTEVYNENHKKLLENFFWKEGNYLAEFVIKFNEDKIRRIPFGFTVTKDDEKKMRDNLKEIAISGVIEPNLNQLQAKLIKK